MDWYPLGTKPILVNSSKLEGPTNNISKPYLLLKKTWEDNDVSPQDVV